jgi:lipoyl(octanoyl) transferase
VPGNKVARHFFVLPSATCADPCLCNLLPACDHIMGLGRMTISVIQLGQVDYPMGLEIQQKLVDLRKGNQFGDVLLLLEHTPVITLGRNAKAANVIASPEQLSRRGVEVFECDRGGDVTFHGPGQLVGYPIFDLRGFSRQASDGSPSVATRSPQQGPERIEWSPTNRRTLGAVDYVRRLEEVLIRTCAEFEIPTQQVPGLTGVWRKGDEASKQDAKIAAIGVHISRGVTSHGFALNVSTDLSFFNLIVPCGIQAKRVTSLEKELGHEVELRAVAESVARNFADVFGRQVVWFDTLAALFGNSVGVPLQLPRELRQLHGGQEQFLG